MNFNKIQQKATNTNNKIVSSQKMLIRMINKCLMYLGSRRGWECGDIGPRLA